VKIEAIIDWFDESGYTLAATLYSGFSPYPSFCEAAFDTAHQH
jgi:hypothetical protein